MIKNFFKHFGVVAFILSNISCANDSDKTYEIVRKFKPESQNIINSSPNLTMEKLATILNIEAGEELIGVRDGKYIPLKSISVQRRSEIGKIESGIIKDIIRVKYKDDIRSVKYFDFGDAITDLYDDSKDYEHIKNMK